jgi:uncharacterized protein (DUF2252 family)
MAKSLRRKDRTRGKRARSLGPALRTREESLAAGHAMRKRVPRSRHATWKPRARRRDPVAILEESNRERLPELVPIRYGRMLRSPFTFLRGSAALMAHDLAGTPSTGLRVQACGDCHLLNFGIYATPERNLVFDLNDFDETLPAPWEWDLKRLTTSIVVAARDNRMTGKEARQAVMGCVRAYQEQMRESSRASPLEVWYARLDMQTLIEMAPDAKAREFRVRLAKRARDRVTENIFPKIASKKGGRLRLVDQPPLLHHVDAPDAEARFREALEHYRASLSDELRVLLDRFRLEDFAMKVVGIGSVGTRCMVGLFSDAQGGPLLLQIKEARRSVLEPYAGKSPYEFHGERVVMGQRLMQSSSDIFLGWARGRHGFHFFVRQLRDMKMSVPLEGLSGEQLARYARACGWTLARAHAKSGDAAAISGYLGKADSFAEAIADFSASYADQTEQDHAALVKAVNAGRVKAIVDV